jgi:acyl-CoA synthetase (NDP forming)
VSLDAFFQPRSIAVVGASADASSISGRPLRLLRQRGYRGAIYPVNPRHAELEGLRCYPRISDPPGPVDLAVVVVPARRVSGVVRECAAAGVRYAMVLSSGFDEAGPEGRALQAELSAAVAGSSLRICGPNCEGFYNAHTGLAVGFSPALDPDRGFSKSAPTAPTGSGPVAIVAQSGGQGFALLRRGMERGLRFSLVVSTGNDADLGWSDYVDYLLDDPSTRVILGFVEGLRDARRLIGVAARAAALGKPLVIAKIGRSVAGQRAAMSHTGNLVGSDDAYSAAFRQLGVVRVDDVDEMLDVAAYFSHGRLPAGRRVAILTASGGAGAWLADAAVAQRLELPPLEPTLEAELRTFIPTYASTANPVDITAQAVYDGGYERALRLLARSGRFDAIVSAVSLAGEHHASELTARLTEALDGVDTPLVYYAYTSPGRTTLESLAELGIPCYPTPARAARALAWAASYAEFRRRKAQVALLWPVPAGETLEPEPTQLLAAAGIPELAGRSARTPDQAAAIHARLGGPVALKLISPELTHKTDVGGVRLNLTSACEVRAAFDEVLASAGSHHVEGVLVQAMAPAGVELILALKRDPALGPLILVGMGGTLVELLSDRSFRLAPISPVEARAMLDELRGAPLLRGFRGRPPADMPALVDALVRLSEVALRLPDHVLAFEINPLLVLPVGSGIVAVDTRLDLEANAT